jgi:hypothetical protein
LKAAGQSSAFPRQTLEGQVPLGHPYFPFWEVMFVRLSEILKNLGSQFDHGIENVKTQDQDTV